MNEEYESIVFWPEVFLLEEPFIELELLDTLARSDLAVLDLVDLPEGDAIGKDDPVKVGRERFLLGFGAAAVAGAGFPVAMIATDSANKDFPLRCAGALYPKKRAK